MVNNDQSLRIGKKFCVTPVLKIINKTVLNSGNEKCTFSIYSCRKINNYHGHKQHTIQLFFTHLHSTTTLPRIVCRELETITTHVGLFQFRK